MGRKIENETQKTEPEIEKIMTEKTNQNIE
jgi:hypothetical protein